jgi:SAM-dependent methyltransferase
VINFIKKSKKVDQYSKLALIYDHIMRHVDYTSWANFISSILKMNEINSGNILDVSCGTGSFLLKLSKYGYNLYGCDISAEMINQALLKSKKNNVNIALFIQDMRDLKFDVTFDGAVSLFDSINYLKTEDDLLKNLISVSSILNDKGIFIFDICTESNSLKNFFDYNEMGEYKFMIYHRKSYYLKNKRLQINEINIVDKNAGERYKEIHKQRIYTIEEIQKIINLSPLKLLSVYDNLSFNPPNSQTERIDFVLNKK